MNDTERQPGISFGLARVYLNATDPKLAKRTWQEVMENIVSKKTDETRRRWEVAIKDRNFVFNHGKWLIRIITNANSIPVKPPVWLLDSALFRKMRQASAPRLSRLIIETPE